MIYHDMCKPNVNALTRATPETCQLRLTEQELLQSYRTFLYTPRSASYDQSLPKVTTPSYTPVLPSFCLSLLTVSSVTPEELMRHRTKGTAITRRLPRQVQQFEE